MRNSILTIIVGMLLFVGSIPNMAQEQVSPEDYNPSNPPEPQENLYYKVDVASDPAMAAYVSGKGKFLEGTKVTVSYSLRTKGYEFKYWTLNGEEYTTSSSFTYTLGAGDANFVAHFEYNPVLPDEPQVSDIYRLYLESDTEGACSFNIHTGTKVTFDNYQLLKVNLNQGYDFLGWYEDGKLISESTSFNYLMPDHDVTLLAKFIYNPTNPADPESDGTQTDVQATPTGDVNRDGVINVFDIVAIINKTLEDDVTDPGLYDVNRDGVLNVQDIVKVINLSLE